jgi:hypothetical protein
MNYVLLFTLLLAIVLVFMPRRSQSKKKRETLRIIQPGKRAEISSKIEVHS